MAAAGDDLRRELERRLHDGIQQDLVALAVKLQLASQRAETGPEGLRQLLDELRQDVHAALDDVRQLAWDVFPALLLDRGLVEALRAVPVEVEADSSGRYPRDVEAAVYFSCLDVLARVPATHVTMHIEERAHVLRFELHVDRDGFDPPLSVADRIGAVGGETSFRARSISGAIPLAPGRGSPP